MDFIEDNAFDLLALEVDASVEEIAEAAREATEAISDEAAVQRLRTARSNLTLSGAGRYRHELFATPEVAHGAGSPQEQLRRFFRVPPVVPADVQQLAEQTNPAEADWGLLLALGVAAALQADPSPSEPYLPPCLKPQPLPPPDSDA